MFTLSAQLSDIRGNRKAARSAHDCPQFPHFKLVGYDFKHFPTDPCPVAGLFSFLFPFLIHNGALTYLE